MSTSDALIKLLKAIDPNAEAPATNSVASIIDAIAVAVAAKNADAGAKTASKSTKKS